MIDSREIILARIRSATQNHKMPAPIIESHGPLPQLTDNLPDLFIEKAISVATRIEPLNSLSEVAPVVSRILVEHNAPPIIRRSNTLHHLSLPGLTVLSGRSENDDQASLVQAFCGVAETGTLVFLSGPDSPSTLNFIPDIHIVLLSADKIVGHYEAAWQLIQAAGTLPRHVHFVTGPSRTGDIAQTLQTGIHGPRFLYVLMYR